MGYIDFTNHFWQLYQNKCVNQRRKLDADNGLKKQNPRKFLRFCFSVFMRFLLVFPEVLFEIDYRLFYTF